MIDVKDLDRRSRHLIDDDVGQTGNHKFTRSWASSRSAPQGKDVKAIGGVEKSLGDSPGRGFAISLDV